MIRFIFLIESQYSNGRRLILIYMIYLQNLQLHVESHGIR